MNNMDKNGFVHDKEVKADGSRSSNNGWIYSAYYNALTGYADKGTTKEGFTSTYMQCIDKRGDYPFTIKRMPDLEYPPISIDELIGMASLGVLRRPALFEEWEYHKPLSKKYSLKETVDALIYLKDKHRNTVWKEKLEAAYPVEFKIWHPVRYYMKRLIGKKPTLLETSLFYLTSLGTILKGTAGERNLVWLMLHDTKSKLLIKLIDREKNFLEYFGKDHLLNNLKE